MNESYILILLGIAGVLFHCLAKMKTLQDASRSANLKFNWIDTYVKKDSIAIIMSFISVGIWYLCYGEVSMKYPILVGLKRVSFVMAGIVGSFFIQFLADRFTNSAKKQIQKFVDVKSNIADIVIGTNKTDTVKDVIDKGNKLTGEDVTQAPPAPKDVTPTDAKQP